MVCFHNITYIKLKLEEPKLNVCAKNSTYIKIKYIKLKSKVISQNITYILINFLIKKQAKVKGLWPNSIYMKIKLKLCPMYLRPP